MKKFSLAIGLAASLFAAAPVSAQSLLTYVGECVPFAREASGIQIYGDAYTWWDKAAGHYQRGGSPRVGAVVVFARSQRLPLGHVAVVSRVIDDRVVMVSHANWSRYYGERGHAEQDVTLTDTSPNNDWSQVRVWYRDMGGLGSSTYPVSGFIYGTPVKGSRVVTAQASPELTGHNPDIIGALLDSYR